MSDESKAKADREGIHIERELADSIAIEEELDANVVGPFRFPDPGRRRIAGWVFLVAGLVAIVAIDGGWILGVGFALLAIWQFLSAWPLAVDENHAMTVAGGAVEFAIGHASAAVRFHGWRSRPRWSVVLYSASEPPDQRALVVVDAVSGAVVEEPYIEDVEAV
jgi:hypothetical protein